MKVTLGFSGDGWGNGEHYILVPYRPTPGRDNPLRRLKGAA